MNLITYLESLPRDSVAQLYQSHWTCQAVLRSLPPIAKQYVMRMLMLEQPVGSGLLASWIAPAHASKHAATLLKLVGLQLLQKVSAGAYVTPLQLPGPAAGELYQLNPLFKQQLLSAITGGMAVDEEHIPEGVLEAAPPLAALEEFGRTQWEALLLYVLGPEEGTSMKFGTIPKPPELPHLLDVPPLNVKELLEQAGYITIRDTVPSITSAGFAFLLLDTYQQLWAIVQQYVRQALARSGSELAGVISFLFQLGFRQIGRPWAIDTMPMQYQVVAGQMAQIGLLQPFLYGGGRNTPRGVWVCPTRMASVLVGAGQGGNMHDRGGEGFIIVETNYKIRAFTSSRLHLRILKLFTRPEVDLPGMFIGRLTRASTQAALDRGLTADQMIEYLVAHPHKQVAKKVPIVPEVVSAQLRLWQADLQRVHGTAAVLYQSFEEPAYFRRCTAFALERGTWLFDDGQSVLIARADGHEDMKALIKAIKTPGML